MHENAVQHYIHLRQQGLPHERVLQHVAQRFAVRPSKREAARWAERARLAMIAADLDACESRIAAYYA